MSVTLKPGDKAPPFNGISEKGESISLAAFTGKKVVVYFYPKDNTPTCTEEACNLRDNYQRLLKAGYTVLGISTDSVKKHQNFIKKFNLPFSLISDEDHHICDLYGVWDEKKLFGRKYMGILRTTFVINEKGEIEKIIEKVESKKHTEQLL
ncbi:MAG: thioredoxin-dependent thiol peroxidase [Bacteroidia bacterium]|nr:thioredoxin-dependent thiol peroxidase [Bacteroidia bacterium]